jgi:hypothetical protein
VAPVSAGQTPTAFVTFPSTQLQGDIPKIAIATGDADSVECVLRKVGIADSEFTDPTQGGRINFYLGTADAGATISSATPSETALMSTAATLTQYDVLMLPCEGTPYARTATELQNLASFANSGGRVYASHYAYSWMDTTTTFSTVAKWTGTSTGSYTSALAEVDPTFSGGATLTQWLQETGASTTPGQITLSTIRQTQTGVVAPTQSWLKAINQTGAEAAINNITMQLVWDTPVVTNTTTNQCGRVLFNEYHVENPTGSPNGVLFPNECPTAGTALTPQEKLLEYSLFELTNDGGAFTLTPPTQDFGTAAVGFNSAPQTFTFTNNSTFATAVSAPVGSQDFNVLSTTCGTVQGGGTCTITMVFNPSQLGAETGSLSVTASGTTLTSALTGNGIPDLSLSISSLTFGSLDVGATATQTFNITNAATGPVPVPALVVTGDFSAAAGCSGMLAAGASCAVTVTFKPTTSGLRTGTLALQTAVPGTPATLAGNGVDFTITASPASGTVIAGYNASTTTTTTPLAGFANALSLTCTTNAPGSTCTLSSNGFTPASAVTTGVTITTTAEYAVVGYSGVGGGWLSLLGLAAGSLLWMKRRSLGPLARSSLTMVVVALMLGAASIGLTGCITATDGFLAHSATYSLTTTAK